MDNIASLPHERGKKITEAILLAVYLIITFIGVLNHELWFDEAQAWCIARDTTLLELPEVLKHEGHPALWYLILMPFAKSGASCEIICVISWVLSAAAAIVLMIKAPFGTVLKAAVLFSSGFLFFNSVNSRVYCLIPLLLFLIAAVYPQRAKHPLVFGLLVGLLANTHIMMSGFVAFLGIQMLIELIQGIKQEGLRKNLGRTGGLIIAGLLVLALIVPLLGSLGVNSDIQNRSYSLSKAANGIFGIFSEVGRYLMIDEWNNVLGDLFSYSIGVIIIVIFIVLFNYRKSFVAAVVFLAFFVVACGIIWYVIPPRASNFLYTLAAIYWIAKENESPKIINISYNNTNNGLIGKAAASMIKAFCNPNKTIPILLSVVLFSSSVSGLFWLFRDYGYEYTLSRSTVKYMEKNLPEGSVVVTLNPSISHYEAYTSDRSLKYYALEIQEFSTYNPHIFKNNTIDSNKIIQDLSEEENLYFLYTTNYNINNKCPYLNYEPLYYSKTYTSKKIYGGHVELYKVTLDEVVEIAHEYEEYMQENAKNG